MSCTHCGKPLKDSIRIGAYKSCPKCSKREGRHVFYQEGDFGFTELRITETNPDGIQSYCTKCRDEYTGPFSGAIYCPDMFK